ncbi:DUF7553 family protein [Halorussus halophilus]|uniref:DUF7553 family protein n=1 Tax=Halorussus halophilus TaxID=2650975 RepID=UPI0013010AF9|nr:hypothetical protein [Halorussus halophilus]
MNKNFKDAWYYERRAAQHLYRGIREELEPVENRIRKATGREKEAVSRTEKWRAEIVDAETRAGRRAKDAVRRARSRV